MENQRYTPITGNPARKTQQEDGRSSEGSDGSSQGRAKRVSVTPRDLGELEAVAAELGLPLSKVYNMAFQALREKLGRT